MQRLLRGEDLDAVSRELSVKVSSLAAWRDEEGRRLQAKVGELTLQNELLHEKIGRLEANVLPASRRPRR